MEHTVAFLKDKPNRCMIAAIIASILLWDTAAWAIGEDIPILTNILVMEVKESTQLGMLLTQASATVKELKEMATLGKTVYGAIDEISHMNMAELKNSAFNSLVSAFPEITEITKDIRDIRDLNYRDYRAYQTLRGILWENLYGPSIETIHNGHDDLDLIASTEDLGNRQNIRMAVHRAGIQNLRDDCDKGNGACMVASHRAQVSMAQQLSDLTEITAAQLDLDKSAREAEIAQKVSSMQSYDRWMFDLKNHLTNKRENKTCKPGHCLYERYGSHVDATMAKYKNSHPKEFLR